MRLFIAREALDPHLKVAGDAVMPGVPMGKRLAGVRARRTLLRRVVPEPLARLGTGGRSTAEFGRLAGHLRWVERTSRRLARQQFHLMVLNGPALEQQAGAALPLRRHRRRAVRDGRDLRARAPRPRAPRAPTDADELADLFCRHARRKVERLFAASAPTTIPLTYRVARGVLDGARVARGRHHRRARRRGRNAGETRRRELADASIRSAKRSRPSVKNHAATAGTRLKRTSASRKRASSSRAPEAACNLRRCGHRRGERQRQRADLEGDHAIAAPIPTGNGKRLRHGTQSLARHNAARIARSNG